MGRTSRLLLPGAFVAGLVAGGMLVRVLGSAPGGEAPRCAGVSAGVETPARGAHAEPTPPAPRPAAPPAPGDPAPMDALRAQVAAVVAEGRRRGDLDAFLDELEATARRQGRVTAVELLAGLAAVDHAAPDDMDRATSFARRMERVARELGAPASSADAPAAGASAADLVAGVHAAAPGSDRDRLIPAAIEALSRLPLDEQPAAFAALDRATAAGAPSPPAPARLDDRIAEIAAATDGPSRSRLVQGFVRDVDALSPEEQERWLRALDQATARR